MSPSERHYALSRMQRARNTLESACKLAESFDKESAINRLYYACFYAVEALLYVDGRSRTKHTGVQSAFNQFYVNEGIVAPESGTLFNRLFEARMLADYAENYEVADEQVRAWLEAAPGFLDEIAACIRARGVTEES